MCEVEVGGDLFQTDTDGLACPPGEFHIDPWNGVPVALITHAHGDHARAGSGVYYCSKEGEAVLRRRLPPGANVVPLEYGERREFGKSIVSFHPAGHMRGSAQIRVESGGQVWVAAGDYKRAEDPTCSEFEVVPCNCFLTETTFALPIYRWRPTSTVIAEIASWWEANAAEGFASVLFSYALGKAQRVLAELRRHYERERKTTPGAVFIHGTVAPLVEAFVNDGIAMLPTSPVIEEDGPRKKSRESFAGQLVVAPPSAAGTPWMRRFGPSDRVRTGFVSGWMQVRGIRRRRGYDKGFVLSDHADWAELVRTVRETGAKRVLCTHGYSETFARYLEETGLRAEVLRTQFGEEEAES